MIQLKDQEFLKSNGVDLNKSLEIFGDMETYNATLPDFLQGLKEKIDQLKNYKASADMQNYAILVHSLKSDARYFGFMMLGDMAYNHELQSKVNNIDYVYQNFDALMNEVIRVMKVVSMYLGVEDASSSVIEEVKQRPLDMKILVVDDSRVVISFVQKIFSDTYQVITAKDGAEAISLIEGDQEGKIACMLLDIYMPNVNGFGVLEYFKTHNLYSKIPVSVITGAYTQEIINMAKQYPIVDLLAKPFNENNVKDVILKTIAAKEL